MKAIWNNSIIAESNQTKVVENNHYCPKESVKMEYLTPSDKHTICPWKGEASYYNINVDPKTNEGAAWYYPHPSVAAKEIKNYIAFWRGVKITK